MKIINKSIFCILMATIAIAVPYTSAETVTDRDGHKYKTVKIGKQVWMAENLNYNPGKSNGPNICAGCEDFGRLYSWNSAMGIEPEVKNGWVGMENRIEGRPISNRHQGICPIGWHIPTVRDMRELLIYLTVKLFKDNGNWEDSFMSYLEDDLNQFVFPVDGGRSQRVMKTMEYYGVALCEPGYWARGGDGKEVCVNSFGFSIRSSGTGEYRDLDKCTEMLSDFLSKRKCCSEGCVGDHFAMWLADENTACQDKVERGRHRCEYKPEAAIFNFQQWSGTFFQEIRWKDKNSFASVRCIKD